MKKYILILVLGINKLYSQGINYIQLIKTEIQRIDSYDGAIDSNIVLNNAENTRIANQLYFSKLNEIIANFEVSTQKVSYQKAMHLYLKSIVRNNYNHLSFIKENLEMIEYITTQNNDLKELDRLKTNLKVGLMISDFILLKTYSQEYWQHLSAFYPTDLLNKFKNLAFTPVGIDVINNVAKNDPNAIKQYLGTNHMVDRALKNSKDEIVQLITQIYNNYGIKSKAYILLNEIKNKKMTITEANKIGENHSALFKILIELRKQDNILANYAVNKELQSLSMEKVVEINMRHNDQEAFRFQPINTNNAYEIYTSIVYSEEEIFTSSFLGMYKRMMEKKTEKSSFEFLQKLNFNRFRIFLKQCAGYNKINDFFATMSPLESETLIQKFASGLHLFGGDLNAAVDVADTYGSLTDENIKKIFTKTIDTEFKNCLIDENDHGIKLYGLLLKLIGGSPELMTSKFKFEIPLLDKVLFSDIYKDNIHIQQHFFFDDEDGQAAFNNWLNKYPSTIYNKEDKGSYIVFKSKVGKNLEIYANKPNQEFQGREALLNLFEKTGRYPDLIVHRGHSYYIENTLNYMNVNNRIAILGSCGGYQNISKAMENAPDVHIVSTKQVGTMVVNTVLIHETTEMIREGKDLDWAVLWVRVNQQLKDNPQFKDYIPPYKNLGAKFIKAYTML